MKILAIETSCDETAIAIIETDPKSATFRVLANLVSSQIKLHAKYGGVVPNLARREHEKNLVPVLVDALKTAKLYRPSSKNISVPEKVLSLLSRETELQKHFAKELSKIRTPKIDALAVTYGPGLAPALWTGVNFANALSALWKLPLIPINHMEGHIFSSLIKSKPNTNRFSLFALHFPAIALLVSGGHTELHLIKKLGRYERLGETLDDAAGEAFDKVAKMLSLPYPGGPAISKAAEKGNPLAIAFPRPLLSHKNLNFSFSGLKTSVLYYLRDHLRFSLPDVAASFEEAAVEVLVEKTIRAAETYHAKTVLLGGGVAANKKLRKRIAEVAGVRLSKTTILLPDLTHTGDNALMIAAAAAFTNKQPAYRELSAESGLKL